MSQTPKQTPQFKKSEVSRTISFIKDAQILSVNESYNTEVLKVSSACYMATNKAMQSLYGMRAFWPVKVNMTKLMKVINEN